jgi:hypothetical protein
MYGIVKRGDQLKVRVYEQRIQFDPDAQGKDKK